MASCPESITRQQLTDACSAFCEVLGLDPAEVYMPLVVTGDKIHLTMVVSDTKGHKQLAPAGNLASTLGAVSEIRVRG